MNCTECNTKVTRIEDDSHIFICAKCGWTYDSSMNKRVNVGTTAPADERPDIPKNTKITLADVVLDFYSEDDGTVIFTSKTYLPKEEVEVTPFDPNTPAFKFYSKLYRKRFKNRRRYRYALEKRMQDDLPI